MGEGGKLHSDPIEKLAAGIARKCFYFQTAKDDGIEHFRAASRQHTELWMVLVFHGDEGWDSMGSHLIHRGDVRSYYCSEAKWHELLAKHGYDPDTADDEDEWRYYDAELECLDHCMAIWDQALKDTMLIKN